MPSEVTVQLINEAIDTLDSLKRRVESRQVDLRHSMPIGFTHDPTTFHTESTSDVVLESIGSINGNSVRHVIIYEKVFGRDVSYGIFDEELEACYPISIEKVLEWMMPTAGEDSVERDMISKMILTVVDLID